MVNIKQIIREEIENDDVIRNIKIEPSKTVVKNICKSEKFCQEQGEITFGQLKAIVENATKKRLYINVGEGGYKATIRLLPWFLPQLAIGGFIASTVRALNKIMKPTLTETESYKTWWGKAVMKIFDLAEGDINTEDPLSRVFFISDGLMTMLNDKYKIKFAKYISELASVKPDNEVVPDFFVENELRKWLNDKFLLKPPLALREGLKLKYLMKEQEDEFEWVRDLINQLRYHEDEKSKGYYNADNKKIGYWEFYWPNGELNYKGEYINGKINGPWEFYYYNGELHYKGEFIDNRMNGEWEYYYENGGLKSKGEFINNRQTGSWEHYHSNGGFDRIVEY